MSVLIWVKTVCKGSKQMIKVAASKERVKEDKMKANAFEPVHEISNNVVCVTSKGSDQPAHTRSLIRAIACRLSIL